MPGYTGATAVVYALVYAAVLATFLTFRVAATDAISWLPDGKWCSWLSHVFSTDLFSDSNLTLYTWFLSFEQGHRWKAPLQLWCPKQRPRREALVRSGALRGEGIFQGWIQHQLLAHLWCQTRGKRVFFVSPRYLNDIEWCYLGPPYSQADQSQ